MGQIKKDMTEVKRKREIKNNPLIVNSKMSEKKRFTCILKNRIILIYCIKRFTFEPI